MSLAELPSWIRVLAAVGVLGHAGTTFAAPGAASASVAPLASSVPSAAASAAPASRPKTKDTTLPTKPSVPLLPSAASEGSASPEPSASVEPAPAPAPSASASAETAAESAAPSAAPPPSASASPPEKAVEASAKIRDAVVFVLQRPHGSESSTERAAKSSEALARALEISGTEETKFAVQGEAAVVYAGNIPVVELYPDDAKAAGYPTVETHAAFIATRVGEVLATEKRRSAIAGTVFSISLLVFFGLIAFYVIRKVGDLADSIRKWMIDNPDRITGLRVQSHEVVGPTALRGGLLIGLILGRVIAQIGVFYLWLVFALSLFQATRPLTTKLTGFVVSPLSDLAARVAASLPLAVVAAVSGVALYVFLRFVQLFFEGVARRQTTLSWLPADLAAPTSVLLRIGTIVTAFVFAAPIVTGDAQGALARTGSVALLAVGIASTPLLSTMVLGAIVVYGRRVRVGQHVSIGVHTGKVRSVGLLDVRLVEADGTEVRIPHFASLVQPTRLIGDRPRASIDLSVFVRASIREVRTVLIDATAALGDRATVDLIHVDGDAAHFKIGVTPARDTTESDVRMALIEALSDAGHHLAKGGSGARPS